MKKQVALLSCALMVAGCASSPDKIQSSYVSPVQYKNHDCDQIGLELESVSRRATELQGRLQKTADNDSAQMAIGMILFWPALFFLEGGDGPEATEYARLKGERETLEKVAIQKKCDGLTLPAKSTPESASPDAQKSQSTAPSVGG